MKGELNQKVNFLTISSFYFSQQEILSEKIGQYFRDEKRINIYCFEDWASRKSRPSPWAAFVDHFLFTDMFDIYTKYKTIELAKIKCRLCIIHVMSQFSCKNTFFFSSVELFDYKPMSESINILLFYNEILKHYNQDNHSLYFDQTSVGSLFILYSL